MEDCVRADESEFLTPTVLSVKKCAENGLLLSMGIVLFVCFTILSLCDFRAGLVLLPLGTLILVSHIITFKKAGADGESCGLNLLSFSYALTFLAALLIFLWVVAFDGKYIPNFISELRTVKINLPEPLNGILNHNGLNLSLVLSVLTVGLLGTCFAVTALNNAKRKNIPYSAMHMVSAVLNFAVTIFFGFSGGKMLYSVLTDDIFVSLPLNVKIPRFVDCGAVILLAVFAALEVTYGIMTFVKMKNVKNVIQKQS